MNDVYNIGKGRYECKYLVSYSLQNLLYKDKVRFFYALKGRGSNMGIVSRLRVEQIARSLFLVSENNIVEFRQFLEYWKISYIAKKVYFKV